MVDVHVSAAENNDQVMNTPSTATNTHKQSLMNHPSEAALTSEGFLRYQLGFSGSSVEETGQEFAA